MQLCIECQPGSYCPDGLRVFDCPRGTFSQQFGGNSSSTCQECPYGTTTASLGSRRPDDCIATTVSCDLGRAGVTCAPCPSGTVSLGGNML